MTCIWPSQRATECCLSVTLSFHSTIALQRPRKRLTELLLQAAGLGSKTAPASAAAQAHAAGAAQRGGEGEEKKQLHVRFFLSPLEILPRADDPRRVGAIRYSLSLHLHRCALHSTVRVHCFCYRRQSLLTDNGDKHSTRSDAIMIY